jgi:predicted dehydrogenase
MAAWHHRPRLRRSNRAARGSRTSPRIALVGCGAIAEKGHLPALVRLGVAPTLLVDNDESRLRTMSRLCGSVPTATTLDGRWDEFDAGIVAAPPSAHAVLCEALLAAGKHVLVEKPMASDAYAARRIVAAASGGSASLHVAHMRRFLDINRWVRRVLDSGVLGSVWSVVAEEGAVYSWEGATAAHFRPESAGGGVLLDAGVHTLDILRWWLGPLELTQYRDDNLGGVEANAALSLSSACCERVELELSRSRRLSNSVRLRTDRGDLVVGLHANHVVMPFRLPRSLQPPGTPQTFEDLFAAQTEAWIGALSGEETDLVGAADGAAVMELIQASYIAREQLTLPWTTSDRDEAEAVGV